MADLARHFSAAATREGSRPALISRNGQASFAEIDQRAAAFAARCAAKGLGKGDRVLIAMPIGIELYIALAACWRLGAVAVFPEPAMGLKGLRHAVSVTRPKALFASGPYRLLRLLPGLWSCRCLSPSAGDAGQVDHMMLDQDDPALISFTSGSTGKPKAIPRSHGFLMAQYAAVRDLLASDKDEIDLVAFPVFALVNLAEGRSTVLPDWKISSPDTVTPEALARWIRQTGATRALLPPALCEVLAKTDVPQTLHSIFTGGGPVKPALVQRLQAQNLRVVSVYGSTEAEPIAELDWAEVTSDDLAAMGTGAGLLTGKPVAGTEVRIEDGEIWVSGAHVNAHYLDPAAEAGIKVQDGDRIWHRTDDAGRIDAAGRLWLLGRWSAAVDGAEGRIYPFAAELAAETWPGVDRAALTQIGGQAALAIEGAAEAEALTALARDLGIATIRKVPEIPLDRRHRSKTDYGRLRQMLGEG